MADRPCIARSLEFLQRKGKEDPRIEGGWISPNGHAALQETQAIGIRKEGGRAYCHP